MHDHKGRIIPALLSLILLSSLSSPLRAEGHFEINVHFSYWTLDVIHGLVEGMLSDALEGELKDRLVEEIREDHPTFVERSYQQTIRFDTPGHNYGLELRFYPGGKKGVFSLGLAIEQSTMKVSFHEVSANLIMSDPYDPSEICTFDGRANASFIIKPLTFHLNMRWDFMPSRAISPYLTIGGGISTSRSFFDARYEYKYGGTLTHPDNSTEEYSESDSKTLRQIRDENREEGEDFPLNFLPVFQFNLGVRARLTGPLNMLVDAGFFDGFMLRGGLSVRL